MTLILRAKIMTRKRNNRCVATEYIGDISALIQDKS